MKKCGLFLKVLKGSKNEMEDISFLCSVRAKTSYFTRSSGKIGFVNLIGFMLNFNKKSIQIELDNFFEEVKVNTMRMTKQAFSEARQKVLPKAFTILNKKAVKTIYEEDCKKYKGYRIFAIDGSVLSLNNTEKMRKSFGCFHSHVGKVALAQASALYDIENDLIIDAAIDRYETNEREMAHGHIEVLVKEYGVQNDLILFDRGYPSKKLIAHLSDEKISYIMRVQSNFTKEINEVKTNDEIVELKYEGKNYPVRIIKFPLENGEEEKIISNILNSDLLIEDFKKLYFKRWGIENKYDELKNRLQIENFTGETEIAVQQDFHAAIYLMNMAALLKSEANDELNNINSEKNLKYQYKVNTNILIGKLKDKLILMILEDDGAKRGKMYESIMLELMKNIVPIRPGRRNARKKKGRTHKYPPNQKSCL